MTQISTAKTFTTPDGSVFSSMAEALEHVRVPLVKAALVKLTGEGNGELVTWLLDNKVEIENTYEADKVQRVTKSERKELRKALDAISNANVSGSEFVVEHTNAIIDSFKWPTKARVKPEEKELTILAAFNDLTADDDGKPNDTLVQWLLTNKEALFEAYAAGVEKRALAPQAAAGLKEYQEAKAAAKAAGPEALAAFIKERQEKMAAKKAAEKAERDAKKAAAE